MKTSLSTHFTLLAAAALLTHAALAAKPGPPPPPPPSSGTVVLDYLYQGAGSAVNFGLTVAPSGTVYASGTAYVDDGSSFSRGIVLGSGDSGATWVGPLDDWGSPGFYTEGGVMASDAAGNLYTASIVFDAYAAASDHWVVRRSTDAGATWTAVDDFNRGGAWNGGIGYPSGITVDAAGDVYVAGMSFFSNSPAWAIRKGVGGTSFSTVDMVPYGEVRGIFAHPTAGIFAVGTKSSAWLVRRSTDGGATWSNVESFQLSNGHSAAQGIGADSLGNLYAVGSGIKTIKGKTTRHWLVRKSTDGGASFSTIDDLQPSSYAEARVFGATSNGDIYAAGYIDGHWILRKSAGGTGAWITVDDFPFQANVAAANASGNLFLGGVEQQTGHWIVKKY